MNMNEFETKAEATSALADAVFEAISHDLTASLLLSGGSTPGPAYKLLSEKPLDWEKISIGLVDDRWVDETDAASNARLIKETLLTGKASAAPFYPMKTAHASPQEAVATLNSEYADLFSDPDVVILGMGPDGHTASWFPDSKGLKEAMSQDTPLAVAAIDATNCPVAGALTDRMTVTMPPLKRARHAFLLITGEEKRCILEDQSADLPIHRLIAARGDKMEVYWAP